MKTQKCRICNIEKTFDNFSVNRNMQLGIHNICKQCFQKTYSKYKKVCPTCNKEFRNMHKDIIFCSKSCSKIGNNNPSWNGGIHFKVGYIYIRDLSIKKFKGKYPYICEHRKIMEEYLGRKLYKHEIIHHKNFNKKDNRIENLLLFKNQSEHLSYHNKIKKDDIGNPINPTFEEELEILSKL